ncbi:MAG: hypothetical protein ACYSRP_07725 [Planctomycetota bacterium]|jgi:hypothetical protein
MEMNIHPGRGRAIIHLNGPCKLDVMRYGHFMSKLEVSSGKKYTLVIRNMEGAEESEAWFEY